jgi:Xaa-Pro dipeptidase
VPGAPFSAEEYAARVAAVRAEMRERGLDALLVASPENVYYLVGLSHQGYFVLTALVLPADGTPYLVARTMERATIEAQAPDVCHVGYADDESAADGIARALRTAGLEDSTVGVAKFDLFLPLDVMELAREALPRVRWVDSSRLVEERRTAKSPAEIACIRQAAAISDRAVRAGIEAAGIGINEREIAADVYRSMILGGSEYPGFVPLVRSTQTLHQEHVTWHDYVLAPSDVLLLELSASVARYHAPLSRVVHIGSAPDEVEHSARIALAGLDAVVAALRPGTTASEVYAAWQAVIDEGLGHDRYRRHHCGYSVGIGFPPSWVGSGGVVGLRDGNQMTIREGMTFHVLSWIFGQEVPDYVVSDTVLVGPESGELLTSTGRAPRLSS